MRRVPAESKIADAIRQALRRREDFELNLADGRAEFDSNTPIVLPSNNAIERVIARVPGNLAQLTWFALETGARQDDLVKAKWSDIDLAAGEMRIVGKRNKFRTFALCPAALGLLRALPRRLRCYWVFEELIYANVSSRFHAPVLSAQKAAQAQGADLRPFTFHDLWHVFAVRRLKAGWSIYRVYKHLGHESVTTTEMYLAYLTPDEEARVRADAQIPSHGVAVSRVPGEQN